MITRIQVRRDTAANWTSINPVLTSGEIGLETDTGKFKIGDGTSAWVDIAEYFVPDGAASGVAGSLDFHGYASNVNHGTFWTVSTDYGSCYWSAWVKPVYPNETGYYISDGSGGAHTVLNGVNTGPTAFQFTGNIYDGTQIQTIGTADTGIPLGEWVHYEFIYVDGVNMYLRINGIYSFYGKANDSGVWSTPFTGKRRFPPGGSEGTLFVGGSYHNNFPGFVARVQGVEGVVPTLSSTIPTDYNGYIGSTAVRADFSSDYSVPGTRQFVDIGEGFDSRVHHGVFDRYDEGTPYPTWVNDTPSPSTYVPTAPATPVAPGAPLVFDSFSRVNNLNMFGHQMVLGSTEVGSLGVKQWHTNHPTVANGGVGVLYGKAVLDAAQIGHAWVQADRANIIAQVQRPNLKWASTGLTVRYNTSTQDYLKVIGGDTLLSFEFRESASVYFPSTVAVPTGWSDMKVVLKDQSLRVYLDDVLRATKTLGIADAAGVNHGLSAAGLVARYDNFALFAIPTDGTPPSVPAAFTAIAISDSEITLSAFQTSVDSGYGVVAGYEYRRDGGAAVDMGMNASWIVSGLTASTSYNFEIRAYDDSGNRSGWSSVVTRSTLAPPTPLIDAVGVAATVACGLRKLRTAYGGAIIRVRRVSDNVEQDFSPMGASLDWTAITAFKGASSLTVAKLYDQSGNGYDLVQATTTKQPVLDTVNREIDFDGVDDYLSAPAVNMTATNKATVFAVVKNAEQFAGRIYVEHSASVSANNGFALYGASFNAVAQQGNGVTTNEVVKVNTQGVYELNTAQFDRTAALIDQAHIYLNGVIAGNASGTDMASAAFATQTLYVGARAGTSMFFIGSMKEIALFPVYLNGTNRGIGEANINAAYLIY